VNDPRVHARPEVHAEVWVDPTAEQWFWVRHFGRWFAPRPEEERGFTKWLGRFFVVPSTNVTNFSLQYQSYLNDIFHLTRTARVTHFTCMPLITGLYLAALRPLHAGSVSGDMIGAIVLAAWWLAWGVHERLVVWGLAAVAWAAVIFAGARWFVSTGHSPWPPLFVLAFLQAFSHVAEPQLPPRVSGSSRWVKLRDHLRADDGASLSLPTLTRRWLGFAETAIYGTIDEAIASPRLAPIQLLEVLWLLGYAPGTRAAWKDLSARAAASGQPAIDYIGIGGGTTLRARD